LSLRASRAEPVYIAGFGASTPVGRDAWSSAAAVRAGISGCCEHPYMIDTAGEPMRVAFAPWIDIDVDAQHRFETLAIPAIEQALQPLEAATAPDLPVALALALPSVRRGLPADLEPTLRCAIVSQFRRRFSAVASFDTGHAAGLTAIQAALSRMSAGAFDACVVAGAESYLSPESLEWLERNEQLHGAGRLRNAWGFIPGEAAGAVLLAAERAVDRLGLEPLARLAGVGNGFEENRIKTDTVCTGKGLTSAFRGALETLPEGATVTDIFCDMNGEPYRADEFGFACLRTRPAFRSPSEFAAPATSWGDVSAAFGPLAIMLAAIAGQKQYAKGQHALIWASSEGGERAAVLLELPQSHR
jgi:3-oxoacyl-[acyl-carrier-protein] synthase I